VPVVARPSDVFVGRRDELAQLISALEDAEAGRGSLVMLAGEPGIGKTRVVEELCREARDGGARVCWGVSHESAGAPPYWPWVQVIGALLRDRDSHVLRTEMGAGAAVIAEVVPAVREKLPNLGAPVAVDPDQARFRLFDSVTTFLKNAAATQPIVLVLDDLHWADRSSLDLLEFAAREVGASRLLVIGAYRDVELSRQHPLSESLATLSRERRFQRIVLRGLGRVDTGRLVEATGDFAPSPATVDAIHERTEGNPFFVAEVTRDLPREAISPEGDLDDAEDFRIPEGVREAIGARLNRLSDDCNAALRSAAVIGRDFDFALLTAVSEAIPEETLLDAVDRALNAAVIRGFPGPGERYEFSHALIQQTLADELSTSRRARMHARIVGALEELYGDRLEEHVDELAHHCAEAETVAGADKVAQYAQMAGERSLASYAFGEAREHFDRALAALEGDPPDARLAAALFGLGRAQMWWWTGGEFQTGWDNLARAFDVYVELGDTRSAVAVAAHPSLVGPVILGAADLLARALELVPADSVEAGRLLVQYGAAVREERDDAPASRNALERALAIAKRVGDQDLEARVLERKCVGCFEDLDYRGAVEVGLRAAELARQTGQAGSGARTHQYIGLSLLSLGDPEGAWRRIETVDRLLEPLGYRGPTLLDWVRLLISRLRGDLRTMAEIGRKWDDVGGPDVPLIRMGVGAGACEMGPCADLDERIEAALEDANTSPRPRHRAFNAVYVTLAARTMGRKRDSVRAGAVARSALSLPTLSPHTAVCARATVGMAALATGDRDLAAEQYRDLESQRGTAGPFFPVCMDRLLGLLAHTAGMPEQAAVHFEDCLTFATEAGFRFELAWTCHDYAEMLLDPDGPLDRDRALSLIDEGLTLTRELGMRTLETRLASLREKAESMPPPEPSYPDGLTGREVEVLRLIAGGLSNRQIADELFISPNTAAKHVRNILAKTDCANRAQAATYANRHDLTADAPAD